MPNLILIGCGSLWRCNCSFVAVVSAIMLIVAPLSEAPSMCIFISFSPLVRWASSLSRILDTRIMGDVDSDDCVPSHFRVWPSDLEPWLDLELDREREGERDGTGVSLPLPW